MFVVIASALVGLFLGDALFYSSSLGLLLGTLGGVVYNITQKITTLEEKLKDQEEIIENLLDNQPYPAPTAIEKIEEKVIPQPTINLSKNEKIILTLPINEVKEKKLNPSPPPVDEKSTDLLDSLMRVLIGDNPIVRIGGVILFLGLAFFAKFLIDHSIITLEMRLGFLAFVAIGLIVLGWRWRDKEGDYGLILQAIGIATLYLDIYSSAKLYHLIDLKIAFILMLFVVLLASWLSIIQKSLPLILFSITGGFLVPILTSDGSGSHIILFSYYALLNLAIVIIAYFYSWRILNLIGFGFTFVIATWWGVLRYEEELFTTTEPFLILFFVFYLTINILFTKHLEALKIKYVDTAITFGLPFIAFAFQDAMIGYDDTIMGLSALVLALIYGTLAYALANKESTQALAQSFFALMVIFATLAIGYTFEGKMLSTIWTLEAVGTIWIALKQDRVLTRSIAFILMGFTLLIAIENVASEKNALLFSLTFMSALLVLLGFFVILWLYHYYKQNLRPWEEATSPFMLGFGLFIYQFIGFMKFDIYNQAPIDHFIIYTSLVSLLLMYVAKLNDWTKLKNYLGSFLVVGIFFILPTERLSNPHPFDGMGMVSFPLFFGSYYILAYRYEKHWQRASLWQLISAIFIVLTLTFELYYHAINLHLANYYQEIAWGITPLLSFALLRLGERLKLYPFAQYYETFHLYFLALMGAVISIWSIMLLFYVTPEYIPFLNILDMLAIAVFIALYSYINRTLKEKEFPLILLGLYGVVFISIVLARSMHRFGGLEYSVMILDNMSYQMGLSILWSIVAFILMILSQKLHSRNVWIASMGLIAITVLKLLLIDMANSATIERIISFIGAGVLILIIGYFFKIPTENKKDQDETINE